MIDVQDGVPGVTAADPTSFAEFWPFYLSQHLHPLTRVVHATGTLAAVGLGIAGLVSRRPRLIAVAPLLAYGPAFASHFIIEKNRPVTLDGRVAWSVGGDFTMLAKVLSGRVGPDVEAIRTSLGMKPGQITLGDWRDDRENGIELSGATAIPAGHTV